MAFAPRRLACRSGPGQNAPPASQELTVPQHRPINAVYYRNTQLSSRIACFLDFLDQQTRQ